jgi:DNA polymerase-1
MKKNKLLIIDGNALLHRTFHAIPPMITRSGEHTNAVYGFITIFFKALSEIKPDLCVICWDEGKKTFRHKEYKEYKATRVKQADELYSQLSRTREIMDLMDIPNYSSPDFEADDLIATLTEQAKLKNIETIILTGDLDSLQLVEDDKVKIYTMRKGISDIVIYNEAAVKERYGGLGPEKMIEYKAMRGDPSDNIKGLAGIGEKTAITLLAEYGDIENIYENLDKLAPKTREIFAQNKETLEENKYLVTMVKDAPVTFDEKKSELRKFDREKVAKLFQELEFKTLLSRLPYFETKNADQIGLFSEKKESSENKVINKNYELVANIDDLVTKLEAQDLICFDTETNDLYGELVGISFAFKEDSAFYVPTLEHKQEILDKLRPIFSSSKIKKVGHNLKYDYKVMKQEGVEVESLYFDSMIASYVLHPHYNSHSMDNLAFTELGYETMPLSALFDMGDGKKAKIGDMRKVDLDLISQYSCEDADITLRWVNRFNKELDEHPKLKKLFFEVEMPLVKILSDIELQGIKIDVDLLKKMSKEMHFELGKIELDIYDIAGRKFNINSTQQLKDVLFNTLCINSNQMKKTKTGISTAASELEKLRGQHPIIEQIFRYRELSKLTNTYIDALPELVDKNDRVHTSFNQTLTSTGRFSSSEPNLQNIPIRTDEGKKIRSAFIADNGYKLISADYSQIELRVAAAMSGDKEMIKAFKSGKDFHAITASEVLDVPLEMVDQEMRRRAKAINFGMIYGQSPHGLSEATEMTHEEARDYIDKYFVHFHELKKFLDNCVEEAHKKGYTETFLGRRRYVPEINSSIFPIRSAAERVALNTPLQGTAADIIKIAMVKSYDFISNNSDFKDVKLLLTVHDELVFECPESRVKNFVPEIKRIMENALDLGVSLDAEVKVGRDWGTLESIKLESL